MLLTELYHSRIHFYVCTNFSLATLKIVTVSVLLRRSTRRHIPADEDLRHRRRQKLEFRKDVSVEHATVRNSALQLSDECQPTYPAHTSPHICLQLLQIAQPSLRLQLS